jgi:replicative DNA helicase
MNRNRTSTFNPDIPKLPPQAVDVERAVLGAILIESAAFGRICDRMAGDMFYHGRHGLIFDAAMSLHAARQPIDMLTVTEKLRASGTLEQAGGTVYIAGLTNDIAGASHLERHAGIVKEKYIRRKIIELCTRSAGEGYDESEDLEGVISRLNGGMEHLCEFLAGKGEISHISKPLKQSIINAYERRERAAEGRDTGIITGFVDLDHATNGWQPGNLIVLAARPGAGKTAIAIHMARRAAARGHNAVFFSLEMRETELTDRLIVGDSGIDKNSFKSGKISREDLLKAENTAFNDLSALKIHIDDTPRQTVPAIAGKLRLLKKRGLCDMAVIDYLQLITSPERGRTRDEEVGNITRELKLSARELGIPILLLSQMNREVEKRGGKIPMLSDLRESGSIEQDADTVIFIHRPAADGESTLTDDATGLKNVIQLYIRKNRDGAMGTVKITHNESLTAFYDYDYRQTARVCEHSNPDRFHESHASDFTPF